MASLVDARHRPASDELLDLVLTQPATRQAAQTVALATVPGTRSAPDILHSRLFEGGDHRRQRTVPAGHGAGIHDFTPQEDPTLIAVTGLVLRPAARRYSSIRGEHRKIDCFQGDSVQILWI